MNLIFTCLNVDAFSNRRIKNVVGISWKINPDVQRTGIQKIVTAHRSTVRSSVSNAEYCLNWFAIGIGIEVHSND